MSFDDLPAEQVNHILQHFLRAPDGTAGFLDADVLAAVCRLAGGQSLLSSSPIGSNGERRALALVTGTTYCACFYALTHARSPGGACAVDWTPRSGRSHAAPTA